MSTKTDTPDTAKARARVEKLAPRRAQIMDDYRAVIEETVETVTAAYEEGVSVLDMAEIFGVDRQQVYKWLGRK